MLFMSIDLYHFMLNKQLFLSFYVIFVYYGEYNKGFYEMTYEELKAKLKVSAHKFTATAKAAIEAAGGEVVEL